MPFLHGCRGASFGTIADDDSNSRSPRGLLKTDEASVVSALAGESSLDVASATALLGRFTRARLEYATQSEDTQVTAQSKELLNELEAAAPE